MIRSTIFAALLASSSVSSFVLQIGDKNVAHRRRGQITFLRESESSSQQIDVSDLGLTMDDLNAPLPEGFLEGVELSGYESTSRISTVQDDACMWTETPDKIKATLSIPGLRGQPSMCLSVLTASNTVSITAFGRVVWSCILRGSVNPNTASFETEDGPGMVPVVNFEAEKAEVDERWGGFILQIGEDSIL